MEFYLNEIYDDTIRHSYPDYQYGDRVIGLFTNTDWSGEGYCCGWYGAEFYNNTTLIATIHVRSKDKAAMSKGKLLSSTIHNQFYPKIQIGSAYWTATITASTIDKAIDLFFHQKWKHN